MSGWSNYSGMVTSLKINESWMGNRVSKSKVVWSHLANYITLVKEQRVYGSCCLLGIFTIGIVVFRQLRCTLTVHESGYQVGIPSNPGLLYASLTPWFVTGFRDAERSFMIKSRGNSFQPDFTIGLHKNDSALLYQIKNFFGVGTIRRAGNYLYYSVKSVDDIINVLIPHFDTYSLQTQKKRDYLLFKQRVLMMKVKEHLTSAGKIIITNIKANINWGNKSTKGYTNVRPLVDFTLALNPNWVCGFTTGDGSFAITIMKHSPNKTGYRVRLKFNMTQHMRDRKLMDYFSTYFGCGTTYLNRETTSYNVYSLEEINNKIKPFFTKDPLRGLKQEQFCLW
jgi:hypothetical protein